MPDTYTLRFQNFRSLRDVTVDIAPLTVIYGPNGSGKSSLLYGLLTLKNFLSNPSQNIPSLFSYPSISLGGLNEVIHRH
jgi:AAA15 family ATPase/GTPase